MEDILFDSLDFITEFPLFDINGEITGISLDGNNFIFIQEPIIINNKEVSTIFVT